MIFQSKLRSALMQHIDKKISLAEKNYKDRLSQHKADYKKALVDAKQMHLQMQNIALEEISQGVLKSLLND